MEAANIKSPMMLSPSADMPSFETSASASNCSTTSTNLAEARACRPLMFVMARVRVVIAGPVPLVQIDGVTVDIFAPRLKGGTYRILYRLASGFGELHQHRQIGPVKNATVLGATGAQGQV